LKELFLKDSGIKIGEFAEAIDISQKHLSQLINGHVRVSPDMAVRLSKALNTSVDIWINLQAAADAYDAVQAAKEWEPRKVFKVKKNRRAPGGVNIVRGRGGQRATKVA